MEEIGLYLINGDPWDMYYSNQSKHDPLKEFIFSRKLLSSSIQGLKEDIMPGFKLKWKSNDVDQTFQFDQNNKLSLYKRYFSHIHILHCTLMIKKIHFKYIFQGL